MFPLRPDGQHSDEFGSHPNYSQTCRLAATALAAGALAIGVGCASRPARLSEPLAERAGVAAPVAWTAAQPEDSAAPAESIDWIHGLGGGELEEFVALALAQNRDLALAGARVRQAAAQARLAGAERWPQVSAGLSANRSKSVIANPFRSAALDLPPGSDPMAPAGAPLPDLLAIQSTRFGLSADLSWEADLWGRLADGAQAARAGFAAARADFEGARLALAGQVVRRWLEFTETAQQLALAEQTEESFRAQERILMRRFDAGMTSALDVRLARTSTRAAAASAAGLRQQADALGRALEVLLGRYPDRSLAAVAATRISASAQRSESGGDDSTLEPRTQNSDAQAVPPAVLDAWSELTPLPDAGVPAELVRRRPDLAAAEQRYAAAAHEHGGARKLRYPRLTLSASAGTASSRLADILDSDFGVWSLAGGLAAPLITGGRIRAQIDAARAGEEAALENFAAALLTAYREVETSLAAERLLAEREARITELADEAAQAEAEAWERYQRGLVEIPTVLEAQRRAFDSRSQWIAVSAQRRQNRATLHLALGGNIPAAEPADEHRD